MHFNTLGCVLSFLQFEHIKSSGYFLQQQFLIDLQILQTVFEGTQCAMCIAQRLPFCQINQSVDFLFKVTDFCFHVSDFSVHFLCAFVNFRFQRVFYLHF